MSFHYDTMQVCKKWGHKITDRYDDYPIRGQKHCDQCGSETTISCEFCKEKIRGSYHKNGVAGSSNPNAPLYCHKCGKPYPWKNVLFVINLGKTLVSPLKYIVDSIVGIFKK